MDFKFNYSLLSGVQVFFSSLNLLLLTQFSNTVQLNHFLISLSIIGVIQQIMNSPFEQFLYHFTKIYLSDKNTLNEQLTQVLVIALFFSCLISFFFIFDGCSFLLELFNVKKINIDFINKYMIALLGVLFFTTSVTIFHSYFVSIKLILHSYAVVIFPILFQFIGMIYKILTNSDLIIVAYFMSVGYGFSFVSSLIYNYRKLNWKNKNHFKSIINAMIHSVKIRFAHNIHIVGTQILFNMYVVKLNLPNGNFILIAKRFSDAVVGTINGPSLKVLPSKVQEILSKHVSNKSFSYNSLAQNSWRHLRLQYLILFCTLVILCLANIYLKYMILTWCDYVNILSFFGVSIFISLELPYAITLNALRKSRVFILSNISYLILVFLLSELFIHFDLIILFPVSFLCGQIIVYVMNRKGARSIVNYE